MSVWTSWRSLQKYMLSLLEQLLYTGVPVFVLVPLPGLSILTHYPYWFSYLYFKFTDKWVDLGIGSTDSGITVYIEFPQHKIIHANEELKISLDQLTQKIKEISEILEKSQSDAR